MRLAMRWLVYLSLPSVAFAWLVEIDFPTWPARLLDSGFPPLSPLDQFVEAVAYAGLGAATVAVIVGLVKLLGIDLERHSQGGHSRSQTTTGVPVRTASGNRTSVWPE
jgi:hypothetical protein